MKRSTAIRHLVEMGEEATRQNDLASPTFRWPLQELWVTGQLIEPTGEVDFGDVVVMLDVPSAELPWRATCPEAGSVEHALRLGKRPMGWCVRPADWPAWNAENRRVVRFWAAGEGVDASVIDELRAGSARELVEPSNEQIVTQLELQLVAARRHVREIVEGYWNRRESRTEREDRLWRAAFGLTEIEDALERLEEGRTGPRR